MAEQWTFNPWVQGSNPWRPTRTKTKTDHEPPTTNDPGPEAPGGIPRFVTHITADKVRAPGQFR